METSSREGERENFEKLEERDWMMTLIDLYGALLTERQREIVALYYFCDVTFAEIAEQKEVSRQSVADCIKKCRKTLTETENKLHCAQMLDRSRQAFRQFRYLVTNWKSGCEARHPDWWEELAGLGKICDMFENAEDPDFPGVAQPEDE